MYSNVVQAKLLLLLITIGVLIFDSWRRRRGRDGPPVNRMLSVLALLSLYAYVNFGTFHLGTFAHIPDQFHYYLSSKYFHEIGYDGLYGAALRADAEQTKPSFNHIEMARDLKTGGIIDAEELRRSSEFRDRFSAERWREFREDVGFLGPAYSKEGWVQSLMDHGYNAPPSRVASEMLITNALGRANHVSLNAIAIADGLMLALAGLASWRVFGTRATLLGGILLATDVSGFDWIGMAAFRYVWLALLVLGTCALERRHGFTAGLLFGAAVWWRLFPALFVAGLVLQAGIRTWRTRRLDRMDARMAAGLTLATVYFVGLSFVLFDGAAVWVEFQRKIVIHASGVSLNHLGLQTLFGIEGWLLRTSQAAFALTFLMLMPRVRPRQAVALGGLLLFAFGYVSSYDYGWVILLLIWDDRECESWQTGIWQSLVLAVVAVGAAIAAVSSYDIPVYDPLVYSGLSSALLLMFFLWTVRVVRESRLVPGLK